MNFEIRKISHALGAEITGLDISKPLDGETLNAINSAFLEHCVLVFRGQRVTREQHLAFTRYFGEVEGTDLHTNRHLEYPGITLIVNKPTPDGKAPTGRYNGQDWHTDESHTLTPSKATLLRAIELPEVGGDTMFCNMNMAYDALSDGMKKMLEPLNGVHLQGSDIIAIQNGTKSPDDVIMSAHPIVRVHPETGRKSLYMCRQVRIIEGMTADESRILINYLTDVGTRQQNVYRHMWQQHDLVMWDNRCLLHMALSDFDRSKIRHMERTTVRGHLSGHPYKGQIG